MTKKQRDTHEFALYVSGLVVHHQQVTIPDKDVVHRIVHVLRLQEGETLTVFNNQHALRVLIATVTKTTLICTIQEKINITVPKPSITALIPVLKKEALEQAVYAAVELGVTHLMLTKTAKSYPLTLSATYMQRLETIIHAAQEQAKQYAPVTCEGPVALEQVLESTRNSTALKLAAVQHGASLHQESLQKNTPIIVIVGPEADFTAEEKELLRVHGFRGYSLGTTVLRAQQALTVLIGTVRALTV